MLVSLAASLTTLLRAFFLMFIFMYVVGVVMIQGVAVHIEESLVEGKRLGVFSPRAHEVDELTDLESLYGSFGKVILTLFRSISGGDWGEFSQVLADVGGLYILLWVVYISFMVFGLLNILTGIFVDIAMKKAERPQHRQDRTRAEGASVQACHLQCVHQHGQGRLRPAHRAGI